VAKKWAKFPHAADYAYDTAAIKKHWPRLHRGDAEPFPKHPQVLDAWRFYHAGDFQQAAALGNAAGGAGINAAVKAQVVYASHLETHQATRLVLLEQAYGWADAHRRKAGAEDANAHYLYAYALGRYGQGISVAKALAQGFGGKIKEALLTAIEITPRHAEAHTAYGAYQSEVIDKVGALVAGMTYGAKKDAAVEHYETAIKLHPESAIARTEYANGLLLLFGKSRLADAEKLYQAASECRPMDAMERLDVEHARAELD
jgi:tetratricopeptide (TPR) repeat protein